MHLRAALADCSFERWSPDAFTLRKGRLTKCRRYRKVSRTMRMDRQEADTTQHRLDHLEIQNKALESALCVAICKIESSSSNAQFKTNDRQHLKENFFVFRFFHPSKASVIDRRS